MSTGHFGKVIVRNRDDTSCTLTDLINIRVTFSAPDRISNQYVEIEGFLTSCRIFGGHLKLLEISRP